MRSQAHFMGHPLHPMLVPFPIAFLTGALATNIIGWLLDSAAWYATGAYLALAGIVTGLIAAAPGLVDYARTIPPDSSAKRRATYHLSVNVAAIALFTIAWLYRGSAETRPDGIILGLEGAGVALMVVGGWLGGTLVYRNFIGPEHRYANAGKWREQRFAEEQIVPGTYLAVADENELQADQMKLLHVGQRRIVLARTERGYTAFDDRCTHRGGSLAGGVLVCDKVQCLWHGSQFDVHSGQVRAGPAETPVAMYPVQQQGGKVLLLMPAQE